MKGNGSVTVGDDPSTNFVSPTILEPLNMNYHMAEACNNDFVT